MNNVKQTVAKNLLELRKAHGYTQAELAAKLNYSDKSISKWENGESMPDIEVLCLIAQLYSVSLDYLTTEGAATDKHHLVKNDTTFGSKVAIAALMVTAVWFIAAVIYAYVLINTDVKLWLTFAWAFPASFIMLMVANKRFGNMRLGYIFVSCFIWSVLFCVCLQFMAYNVWAILIIGIPLQVAIVLLYKIRK